MKKIKSVLFFFATPAILLSQIVIDQNDMPQPGDTIRLSSTIDYGTFNYEETGNDFIWDFSSLLPVTQKVDTFVDFDETPWVYQLIFWGSSNLAKEMMGFDQYPGFQITDAYEFYKTSSSDFRLVGNAATLNGIPFPNKFDAPDIIFKFPMNPGNVDSSFSSYDIALTGIGYAGGWKKRVNYIDGWGTLITPYGSFQTIRVKSEVDQYDSIYIDTLGYGIPYLQYFTEYKWLGDGFGEPLCTFTENGPITTIDYIDSVRNLIIGIPETQQQDNPLRIYPNPVGDELNIQFTSSVNSAMKVAVFDLQGKKISEISQSSQAAATYSQTFDISALNLETGIYFLEIILQDQTYFQKFMKR